MIGSGKRIENGADGISIQINKTAEALNIYFYTIMDAQMNIHCVQKKGIPYGNMKITSKYSSIFKIPKPDINS